MVELNGNVSEQQRHKLDLIMSRRDLKYDMLIRNGYSLPSFKAKITSMEYLDGVMNGTIFCLKQVDVRVKKLIKAPAKKALNELVLECISEILKRPDQNGLFDKRNLQGLAALAKMI